MCLVQLDLTREDLEKRKIVPQDWHSCRISSLSILSDSLSCWGMNEWAMEREIATKKLNLTWRAGPQESQELLWTHLKGWTWTGSDAETSRPHASSALRGITVSFCPGKCALKLRYVWGRQHLWKIYSSHLQPPTKTWHPRCYVQCLSIKLLKRMKYVLKIIQDRRFHHSAEFYKIEPKGNYRFCN